MARAKFRNPTIRLMQPAMRAPTIKIAAPRAPSVRGRAKAIAHRVGRAAVTQAAEEKHTLAAVAAGAALGFAEKQGWNLPKIDMLGKAGTYGLVAWGIGKWTKNRTARHVATGLLAIAAYQFTASGAISGGRDF